jgi:hypothetical protein
VRNRTLLTWAVVVAPALFFHLSAPLHTASETSAISGPRPSASEEQTPPADQTPTPQPASGSDEDVALYKVTMSDGTSVIVEAEWSKIQRKSGFGFGSILSKIKSAAISNRCDVSVSLHSLTPDDELGDGFDIVGLGRECIR